MKMSKNQSDNSALCGLRNYNQSVSGVVVLKALDYAEGNLSFAFKLTMFV